ncbi:hypothetical protein NDU88_005792 [Pleurodeles waltl]|uniref:Uncharacterized protein n=1 Tax=Pleurodeles waltl TaxID=8319 RepID=A0AAV7TVV1_PLEWA|nr:hypothetical protein NDU88_005792 [Pleurodeles waltl]
MKHGERVCPASSPPPRDRVRLAAFHQKRLSLAFLAAEALARAGAGQLTAAPSSAEGVWPQQLPCLLPSSPASTVPPSSGSPSA